MADGGGAGNPPLASLAIAAHRKYLCGDGDDDAAPLVVSDEQAAWLERVHVVEGASRQEKLAFLLCQAVQLPAPRSLIAASAGVGLAEALMAPGELERVLSGLVVATGGSLLHAAVGCNDVGVSKLLARLPGPLLASRDGAGRTPLEEAVALARVDVVAAWPRSDVERHLRQPPDRPDRPSLWHHVVAAGATMQAALAARQKAAMHGPTVAQMFSGGGGGPLPDVVVAPVCFKQLFENNVPGGVVTDLAKALVGWWRDEAHYRREVDDWVRLQSAIDALPRPFDRCLLREIARFKDAHARRLDAKMRPFCDSLQRRAGALGTPLDCALRDRVYDACRLFYLAAPARADAPLGRGSVSIDARDGDGRTLLQAAIERHDWSLAAELSSHGAYICSTASSGCPLEVGEDPIVQVVYSVGDHDHRQPGRLATLRAMLRRPEGAACAREQRRVRPAPGMDAGVRLLHMAVAAKAYAPVLAAMKDANGTPGAASLAVTGQVRAAADAMEMVLGAPLDPPVSESAADNMIIHELVLAGADPDVRDDNGVSLLEFAQLGCVLQNAPGGIGDPGDAVDYATVNVVALLTRYSRREREAEAARRAEEEAEEEVKAARRAEEKKAEEAEPARRAKRKAAKAKKAGRAKGKQHHESTAPAAPPPARGASPSQPAPPPSVPASPRASTAPLPPSQPAPESPPPAAAPFSSPPPPPPPPATPAAPRRLPPHLRLAAARRAAATLGASAGAPVVPSAAAPAPPREGDE